MSVDFMKIKGDLKSVSLRKSAGAGKSSSDTSVKDAKGSQSADVKAPGVNVSASNGGSESMATDKLKRASHVAEIKFQVESGSYQADSQKTAEKLIDSITDYSLA